MEKTPEQTAAERAEAYAEFGLNYSAQFVPQSRSRNAGEKLPSLNWRVTIANSRASITTDYMQGIAHMPNYVQGRRTLEVAEREKVASEQGKAMSGRNRFASAPPLPAPKLDDVMYSILLDADVLDSATFEQWASDLGYDTDSRKAEVIYRQCINIALQLRAMLGDAGISKLRALFEDY